MAPPMAGFARFVSWAATAAGCWLFAATLVGCTELRDASTASSASACLGCHGDRSSPAPVDEIHQAHLKPDKAFSAVLCEECHVVPTTPLAPGHLDDGPQGDVIFSGAAIALEGPPPSYEPMTGTCSAVACHGGGLAEPALEAFVWDPTQVQVGRCESCHAMPPGGDHPALDDPRSADCTTCHGQRAEGSHADQEVQLALPSGCDSCHGGVLGPAPIDPGHQSHLASTSLAREVACDSCHLVPQEVLAEGHMDSGPPAELRFGGLALTDAANPSWDGATCSGSYCHGEAAPTWGDVGGTFKACDACHGAPPDRADHPVSARCEVCHASVAGPELTITAPERHVDGDVDFIEPSCDSCHGQGGSIAPATGAHTAHVVAGVACMDCHLVPESVNAPGHLDSQGPAEVTLGGLASARGATPSYMASNAACTNVYCHGPSASAGGFDREPRWFDATGTAGQCGACHAVPPQTGPHSTQLDCVHCHTAFPEEHVNGTIDL